jgi:DNA repair exonuclease SbcCD ATPase subunit
MDNLQATEAAVQELKEKLASTEHQYLAQLSNIQEEKDALRAQINDLTEQVRPLCYSDSACREM